jgi:signal transduction histidine kinase
VTAKRLRAAAWFGGIAVAYFVGGTLGLQFAVVHQSATPVWPPTGIALAAFLLLGTRVWPAIFLPAFLLNATTAGSAATSLAIAAGNTLEGAVAAHLARRFAGGLQAFERPQHFLHLAAIVSAAAALSASIGVVSLAAAGYAAWAQAPAMWLTWWLGDVGGGLVVAPAIVLWSRRPRWKVSAARAGELTALLVAVVAIALVVFGPVLPVAARGSPIAFLCLPPLVWAAVRFGPRETATATALTCAVALAGTLHGLGPYGAASTRVALLLLQGYTVVTALMVLTLAAAITEQERVHRAIHHRDAHALSEAEAVAHIGSWTWDIGSDRVTFSEELYRVYGLEPGVPLGYETILSVIHPGDRARIDQAVRAALASGEPFALDYRVVPRAGTQRWLDGRARVVMGPRGAVRMVGTAQDVTERRLAEETSRAFLANAAHELRTPLTSVMGLSDLIAAVGRDLDQPLLAEYCEMLRRQGVRARRMISGLLDVSRMEQGLVEVSIQPVTLDEAVRRAADAVPAAAERAPEIDVPAGLAVSADPLRLEEALVNLLQNAYAYGGRRVGVTARARDEEVRLEVWDDGTGVAPGLVPHLFEPFSRGPEARLVEGSGLGLTIVRGLVQALGGRVFYEAREPQGARFVLSLRRASPPATSAA